MVQVWLHKCEVNENAFGRIEANRLGKASLLISLD